ncbi:LacI family DNA-binding transcriptional regulator [Natronospora cellulosivora (SeqCode)]
MATIKDIAKIAGVSITTVSKVINNYPDIGDETRKKVLDIMKEANYKPNAIARSLSTNKSNSIGVFVHYNQSRGLHHVFFHEILFALETKLGKKGYDFIYFSDLKWKRTCNYLAKCKNRHVDGAIVMGVSVDDSLDELLETDIPVVFLDLDITGKNATYISSNNIGGARIATRYLYQLGHRDIAMITGIMHTCPAEDRYLGFEKEMNDLNLDINEKWILNTFFNEEGGYKSMEKILDMNDKPTAIFCQSDMIAIGAIKAIQNAGYSVPEDFSIIGFDGLEIGSYMTPALTTIKQDTYTMGDKAADLLLTMINKPEKKVSHVKLPVELIERESCIAINKKYK